MFNTDNALCISIALLACSVSSPAMSAICSGNSHTAFITLGQLNPAAEGAIGSVIGSQTVTIPTLKYSCGENIRNIYSATFTRPVSGQTAVANVYSTEIPGLGVRILWPAKRNDSYFPTSFKCLSSCSEAADELKVDFVQTGRIMGGTVPRGKIADVVVRASEESSNSVTLLNLHLATDINIVSKSCMVVNPEISVDLGSYSLSDFHGTAKQGEKIPVSIFIQCPQTSSVRMAFQVANQQPVGTATGVITNTIPESSGGAKNIATKMLASNGFIAQNVTGKQSPAVVISAGTTHTFKYNAQLFITDRANISAGNIAGRVYFNLTIQ